MAKKKFTAKSFYAPLADQKTRESTFTSKWPRASTSASKKKEDI